MSVERSEFEFRVNTPLELAGAKEAAGELERAIGKARARGRNSARLERQLARVRQGMRHFRLAHPGLVEARAKREETEQNQENENELRRGAEEMEAGMRESRRRSVRASHDMAREDEREQPAAAETDKAERSGLATEPPPETGALSEAAPASGTGVVTDESPAADGQDPAGAEPPAAEPDPAGIPQQKGLSPDFAPQSDEAMAEAAPATASAAEPVTADWNAKAQRAVEEMVRQAVSNQARAESQMNSGAEERMAELEQRLQRLEAQGRMTRDGG